MYSRTESNSCSKENDAMCQESDKNEQKEGEHLSSPPVLSGVRVTRSLVLCVCFVDRCLSFCQLNHSGPWQIND
jgi:hypothetical protein